MNSLRSQNNTFKCKVVLLGDQSVGKSSLVLRFVKNIFMEHHAPTIGAAFLTKHLPLDDCTIKFEIWDTAGQERFHSIAPMYYRGSQAAIIVYDITDENSFHKAKAWISELYAQANSKLVILLAGNKADLAHERAVQYQKAEAYAKEQNLLFLETSAKTEQNIEKVFHEIGTHCPRKAEGFIASYDQTHVDLTSEPKEKKCCKQS